MTLMVTGKEPICVVVPDRLPVAPFSVIPVGSVPDETVHAAVPRMPVAVNV